MRSNIKPFWLILAVLGALLSTVSISSAQEPDSAPVLAEPAATPSASEEADIDFAEVLGYGGTVGYAILALSIVGLALAAVFFFELRAKSLVPAKLAHEVGEALRGGDAAAALAASRKSPTFLGHILRSGIEALEDGRPEARNVMADAAESWMSGVVRRVEYLNLIATIAPMLGLLGTVTGMVKTFAALSQSTGPVDPVQLSAGIFQALVTTMMGLSVAIPILLLYTILRNRADHVQATGVAAGENAVAALPESLSHGGRRVSA